MIIRREQMQALEAYMRDRFVSSTVAHVERFFPERCERLGEDGVREWVDHGIERAGAYGIVAERDVSKYIDVQFAFGRDFDTDPQCPWAAAVLTDETIGTPRERVEGLGDAALEQRSDRGTNHAR